MDVRVPRRVALGCVGNFGISGGCAQGDGVQRTGEGWVSIITRFRSSASLCVKDLISLSLPGSLYALGDLAYWVRSPRYD